MRTAQALYGLHIDAFIEGLATEAPKPQEFGLTEQQAVEVRKNRYVARLHETKRVKVA